MGCHTSIKSGECLIHAVTWMILELDEISEQKQTKKIAVCLFLWKVYHWLMKERDYKLTGPKNGGGTGTDHKHWPRICTQFLIVCDENVLVIVVICMTWWIFCKLLNCTFQKCHWKALSILMPSKRSPKSWHLLFMISHLKLFSNCTCRNILKISVLPSEYGLFYPQIGKMAFGFVWFFFWPNKINWALCWPKSSCLCS